MSFTDQVKDELAHAPARTGVAAAAEASSCLRSGGTWLLRGGGAPAWTLQTTVGAVARRLRRTIADLSGVVPTVTPGRPSRAVALRYRVEVAADGLSELGLVDARDHPVPGLTDSARREPVAAVAGVLMGAASISDPLRDAHLEVRAPGRGVAADVRALLASLGARGARAAEHGDAWRVVVKSGEEIGWLLAEAGAHGSYLAWDQGRMRRELRASATRAANADTANLSRAVAASARQVQAINALVDRVGWDGLGDDLAGIALARVANPEASLTELAALVDPPLTRSAVHRGLARLEATAAEVLGTA